MTLMIICTAVLVILYIWYASIISKKNKAIEALSGIDVQLKQRTDLLPNILTIAKKYMDHEKSLLVEITDLRTRADEPYNKSESSEVASHLSLLETLSSKMGQFKIAVENYPVLKADETMRQAMLSYNEAEAQISAARRFYNSAVASLNNSIQIFPGNLIASAIRVTSFPPYKAEEADKAPIDASKYLN
jgi:LemA protein